MMHKWQTARGNKPNIVPAIVSTHPMDVFCQLILVEGDIPGQQGLRILPVATVHWVRVCGWGGFGGYKGDVMFLRVRGWRWLCVYSVYAQQSDCTRLFQGWNVVTAAVLSIGCYFEPLADGTAASLSFQHPLPTPSSSQSQTVGSGVSG